MKQFFRFSILVLALLLPALAMAHDFEVDGIYYNINGNEATVTYGTDRYAGDVIIPSAVTYADVTYSVTTIGANAFAFCYSLTSIVIPNSVTEICNNAFAYCSGLTSFVIPNSVTEISDYAFSYCSGLTSIVIPNSVTEIGEGAFFYCYGLTCIDIPNSLTKISGAVFGGCSGLTGIVIPNSVTSIGDGAFFNCPGLTSINIPNSVTEIGSRAFEDCPGLTSIVIPNSVTSIGEMAFTRCTGLTSINIGHSVTSIGDGLFFFCPALTSIVVESGNPKYDSRNNCKAIIETASNTLFLGCKNTIIPTSVTSIGTDAFAYCSGLTSIVIPNSVTAIGIEAFYNCSGLTSIDIPNSVTEIGDNAFTGCRGLTSIDIPNSVTAIGFGVFMDCTGLTRIVIPNSVTKIGERAFENCTGLTDVYCYIADLSRVSSGNRQFYLNNGDYSGRTLHVLQGKADAYRADEHWNPYFGLIVDDLKPDVPGDVNGDLEVNIADVNAVIDLILAGNYTAIGDVNGDGEINIADINAVIDIILGRNAEPEPEHDWVDLGLPSGTLWATCNVGANSPEEFGHHFAWGETEPKDVYDWSTYKWCNGSYTTITKYCTKSEYGYNGFVDNKTELDLEDDAAYVNWGPSWCMPTVEQQQELYQNCSSVWTTKNGVNGRLFTGPNGNTLFLPAAGCRWDGSLYYVGSYGCYWSRTLYTSFSCSDLAYNLDFTSGYVGCDGDDRIIGFTVRAVRVSQN